MSREIEPPLNGTVEVQHRVAVRDGQVICAPVRKRHEHRRVPRHLGGSCEGISRGTIRPNDAAEVLKDRVFFFPFRFRFWFPIAVCRKVVVDDYAGVLGEGGETPGERGANLSGYHLAPMICWPIARSAERRNKPLALPFSAKVGYSVDSDRHREADDSNTKPLARSSELKVMRVLWSDASGADDQKDKPRESNAYTRGIVS